MLRRSFYFPLPSSDQRFEDGSQRIRAKGTFGGTWCVQRVFVETGLRKIFADMGLLLTRDNGYFKVRDSWFLSTDEMCAVVRDKIDQLDDGAQIEARARFDRFLERYGRRYVQAHPVGAT